MVWYEQPNVAHRLGHPFVHPGGPSVVAEPAAARRQTVQQFQEQATTAWAQLVQCVQEGVQDQVPGPHNGQQQQQQQQDTQQQPPQQPQQQPSAPQLDLSGLAVPPLPRRRLTGPVMLVPEEVPVSTQPDTSTATTPAAAAGAAATGHAAAAAAAAAAGPPRSGIDVLAVPAGCLQLHSWQDSAAAEEPPGEVAGSTGYVPRAAAGVSAVGGGGARASSSRGAASRGDTGVAGAQADALQPGTEAVITLAVMETSRRLTVVQQEIQALGSNTLADLRDAISCPTDKLAEGLGAANPAAYFYIDKCFYDDTRAAAAAECSRVVQDWAQRLGLAGPRHLLQHYEQPDEPAAGEGCVTLQQRQQPQHQELQQQELQQEYPGDSPHKEMQHVQLSELALQASNRPMALFSHQGLCEHAVVVTDVRLLHPADPLRRSAYPRTVAQASLSRRLHCGLCKKLGATALLLNHPETPEVVTVLCKLCKQLFGGLAESGGGGGSGGDAAAAAGDGGGGDGSKAQLIMLEDSSGAAR